MVSYKLRPHLTASTMLVKSSFSNTISADSFATSVPDTPCGNKSILKLFINEGWLLTYSFKVKNVPEKVVSQTSMADYHPDDVRQERTQELDQD